MQLSDVLKINNPYTEIKPPILIPKTDKNIIISEKIYTNHFYKVKKPLPPIMPSNYSKKTFKIMKECKINKWKWKEFTNESRDDDLKLFHWEKENNELDHYQFSEYNNKIDRIIYKEDEYKECVHSDGWTKEQTDYLFDLCYKYDLRWFVISDRYSLLPYRSENECKYRYYSVCKCILQYRKQNNQILTPYEETILNYNYDKEYDIQRNLQFDKLFKISKLEELELKKYEAELRTVESIIKELLCDSKALARRSHISPDDFITFSEINNFIKDKTKVNHPTYPPGVTLRSQRFELTVL